MSDKIWSKKDSVFIDEEDFVSLDAMGDLLAMHNAEGSGDQLIINVLELQMLLLPENTDSIAEFVNRHFAIVHQHISVLILEMGAYCDRGFIYREIGGDIDPISIGLNLDHEIEEKEAETIPEDVPLSYQDKINDDIYLESIAHLEPQAFVEELGLDWEEVQGRFHNNRGNISRNRTDLWIKECVLFGNEKQRDIANYTASPARESLLRLTLSERDLPIIIATTQSLAYIKSREVVAKGDLFVWEDLRGNRHTRGSYSTSEAWTNRTALHEGRLDKKPIQYLLHMYYGIGSEEELNGVMQPFTINAGYEEFTSLIRDVQYSIESPESDGIADASFVNEMKKVLEIGNEANSITVAYVAFMFMYGAIDIRNIKAKSMAAQPLLPPAPAQLDALYIDPAYAGINRQVKEPIDARNQAALSGIRGLIRHFLPEYQELEDDDPMMKRLTDQIFARAAKLATQDLKSGIENQVAESAKSLEDRIAGLETYFQDIEVKQFRQMVEEYVGSDKEKVSANYQLWAEIYVMILLEEAKQGESQDAETSFPGFGQQSLNADDGPIMQKLELLAAYLGMDIPTFNEAQATQTEIWKHQEKMMGSPTGYNPENDPSPLADKSKLEMAQAVMYGFGTNKYGSILAVLFKAFKKKLRWSGGLSENTRQRLGQDFMQGEHLEQLRYIRDEFEAVVPIQNYMFIDSSFNADLKAAHLDLTNRSEGFALPVFRAKRKGADSGDPEVLIIFGRPDKYNVIEKTTLRASLETAEARNLIPPGIFHFNLQGNWDEIPSNRDWQWPEILAIIGIGLAIVAAIAAAPFTGGASTAAVPYLVTAAIGVGIASSVMSMKEKAEIGELTTGVALFEIGMIAANFIPFLATGTRILRGIPQLAKVGKLGQFAHFITHPAVTRLGAGAGVIMTGVSAFMFAESLLTQLDVIADMKKGPEKEKAISELIRFGALTGLMLFVSLKSDFRILKGNPKLSLHASVKAEADTRAKIKDYDARIQNARSRFGGRAAAVVPIPEALIVVAIAKQAEVIFYQLRKVMAKLSTIKDRAAIRAAVEGNPNIKALGLAGDEFDQAYKLAEQVDLHLANHPSSTYHGREDELFSLLMQGKRRFNANGVLVVASPGKMKQQNFRYQSSTKKPVGLQLSRNEVQTKYGKDGLKLMDDVEEQVKLSMARYPTKSERNRMEGPVVTGVRHPRLTKTFIGKNAKALPDPLHPLLEAEIASLKRGLNSKNIAGDPIDIARAGVKGRHSEVYAMNEALFALEKASGKTLTKEVFGEFLLYNRSLIRPGGVPPRCFNCRYITDGVRVIGND
jgi:hypothetical protein